ncbi:hypothetical protein [Paeniglutamicibacter kerguelensis]|uniref:Uncharacterized protein n=1 Tax=Paeniglutamicibacter kerguelensis TaxID=254788 RepID=A0ABS4XB07_9MICC|nr:hypothetical protein [Paeniglutamicibacter kerguelensis]MBP2385645.1 hypothetical protein [Paeniglutamicibacter kerguelensis]
METFGPPTWSGIWASFLEYSRTDVEIRKVDEGRPDFASMVTATDVVDPGVVFEDDRVKITAA